jgi:hypothetical protein
MEASGASFFSGINIIPSSGSAKHIISFLQFRICPSAHTAGNVVHIGASIASEPQTIDGFFNTKNIGTRRTKH